MKELVLTPKSEQETGREIILLLDIGTHEEVH
jgi:hypothetical protein